MVLGAEVEEAAEVEVADAGVRSILRTSATSAGSEATTPAIVRGTAKGARGARVKKRVNERETGLIQEVVHVQGPATGGAALVPVPAPVISVPGAGQYLVQGAGNFSCPAKLLLSQTIPQLFTRTGMPTLRTEMEIKPLHLFTFFSLNIYGQIRYFL